ncbi:DNA cross-link repair 1A protein [Astathelohania contejeani]|uniref:DNA cross-link repair 1A protein n=1 Tax=Astathelohania contejeani TaxID=164912 RepID=A0ABQ7I283_9MICR|nr:DNA cross-link repair 1A protein [Thelohania contejeani]
MVLEIKQKDKFIPNTLYTVDYFLAPTPESTHQFLTHFHSDHYHRLNKSFNGQLYCSYTTANLVIKKLKVDPDRIHPMEMYKRYHLEKNNYVTCIDANHCPGSICLIFEIDGVLILHTGDFRASCNFINQLNLKIRYNYLFLDNTFELHTPFPSQREVIWSVIEDIRRRINNKYCVIPLKYKFFFCTYLIGKEKLFLSVAEDLDYSVLVDNKKLELLKCLDEYSVRKLNTEVMDIVYNREMESKNKLAGPIDSLIITPKVKPEKEIQKKLPFDRITTKKEKNQINIVSMDFLKKIEKIEEDCDRIVVFIGTGWQNKRLYKDWKRGIKSTIKKGIEIIYVPYSEHSSNKELEEFKTLLKHDELINTVIKNV